MLLLLSSAPQVLGSHSWRLPRLPQPEDGMVITTITMVIITMAIGVTGMVITMVICNAGQSSCTRLTETSGGAGAMPTTERRKRRTLDAV